jgi:hypothetical protein
LLAVLLRWAESRGEEACGGEEERGGGGEEGKEGIARAGGYFTWDR